MRWVFFKVFLLHRKNSVLISDGKQILRMMSSDCSVKMNDPLITVFSSLCRTLSCASLGLPACHTAKRSEMLHRRVFAKRPQRPHRQFLGGGEAKGRC